MIIIGNKPLKQYFEFHASQPDILSPNLPAVPFKGVLPQNTLNPNITTGWEAEVENCIFPKPPQLFRIQAITDGSLKDNGMEFITFGGLKGKTLYDSILELSAIEASLNTPFKFSHRCSFHVHLDVTSFTWNQLFNLMALSMLAEPFLFSLCEEHRKGNSYCIPLNQLNLVKTDFQTLNYKETKYWALSVNRLTDLGTMEYRMMHGTTNPATLINWITLLHRLHNFAQSISTKELFLTLKRTPDVSGFLHGVLSTPVNQPYLTEELSYARANATIFLEG